MTKSIAGMVSMAEEREKGAGYIPGYITCDGDGTARRRLS